MLPQALQRAARIAATKEITKLDVASDSDEDWNGVPTFTTKNRGHAETTSAVHRHMKETKHEIHWMNCTVLDNDRYSYCLLIKESLTITHFSPSLNATTRAASLLIYHEGYKNKKRSGTTTNNFVPPQVTKSNALINWAYQLLFVFLKSMSNQLFVI